MSYVRDRPRPDSGPPGVAPGLFHSPSGVQMAPGNKTVDTAGEFGWNVQSPGFPFLRGLILPRFRTIERRREFASSITVGPGPQREFATSIVVGFGPSWGGRSMLMPLMALSLTPSILPVLEMSFKMTSLAFGVPYVSTISPPLLPRRLKLQSAEIPLSLLSA